MEINHFGAELIPFVSKNSVANINKRIFIHIRKDYFDLFIYQGVQLLLFNSFTHKNEEEFLYYLFFVLEQFYLKPNQFTAVFLGKFVKYKKYYAVFNEFHTLTEFILPENSEIDSHHPAPFFNYFYNHEDNFRKFKGRKVGYNHLYNVRPTTDRTKESLFNILDQYFFLIKYVP